MACERWPRGQGQVLDVVGHDLPAFKRLRQHSAVVGLEDRQLGHQGAVLHLRPGKTHLRRRAETRPLPGSAVTMVGDHRTADMTAVATVQANTLQAQRIDTKTETALGEPGLVVEHETLGPLFGSGGGRRAVAIIVVEVEVAHAEGGFTVLDKVRHAQRTDQRTAERNQRQRLFIHGLEVPGQPVAQRAADD